MDPLIDSNLKFLVHKSFSAYTKYNLKHNYNYNTLSRWGGGVGGGDGSVMMIGGGGKYCNRADHGIGITETDAASFVEMGGSATKYYFGYEANTGTAPTQSYSLNLWIR